MSSVTIKGRFLKTFPSSVSGTSPITITSNAGAYIIALDTSALYTGLDARYVPLAGSYAFTGAVLSTSPTAGVGYSAGAGGAVTQITSRTTGVTLNKVAGAITLVSAAGSTTTAKFTVTNSTVAATDTIIVNQKSGTDRYQIFVTNIQAGQFDINFATLSGTTTEQPVFNFAVLKSVAS